MSEKNEKPLTSVRVIDFSSFVAGPSAGKILADWGAEVIRVERFEGDPWRWYGENYGLPTQPEENPLFDIENLNKKLIAAGAMVMTSQKKYGDVFPRHGKKPISAAAHSYKCKNERWLMLCIIEYNRQWPILCKHVFAKPDWSEDERFKTAAAAKVNNVVQAEMMTKEFLTKTSDEWEKLLKAADLPYGIMKKFSEVTADEQAWINDYIFEHKFKNGNTAILPRTPVQFGSMTSSDPAPETEIGEHTKEVLLRLGYTETEIGQMEKQNIVRCPS